jgi:hypothetical protein
VAASSVVFLFDENSPHRLVRSLRELGQPAYHVYDVNLKQAPDEIVLQYAGEREWCIVSSDRSILHRPHERAVLKQFSIGAFFLNDTIAGTCRIAQTFYRHWPEMKRLARSEPRPFLYLIRERTVSRMRRKMLG